MLGPGRFGSTVWADIDLAREGDRKAMNRLVGNYRAPVVELLRRSGFKPEQAEDLAQDVFMEVVEKNLLQKAAPAAGRFRSLLIGVTKNVVRNHFRSTQAKKRGGRGGRRVPLDSRIEGAGLVPGSEKFFDQAWVVHLMNRAFKRLEEDSKKYKNRQHQIVAKSILEGMTHAEVAEELGMSPGAVRNLLHRGKQKLLEFVRQEVIAYTSPGDERQAEIEHIMKMIGDRKA